jgi:hypothetical protein
MYVCRDRERSSDEREREGVKCDRKRRQERSRDRPGLHYTPSRAHTHSHTMLTVSSWGSTTGVRVPAARLVPAAVWADFIAASSSAFLRLRNVRVCVCACVCVCVCVCLCSTHYVFRMQASGCNKLVLARSQSINVSPSAAASTLSRHGCEGRNSHPGSRRLSRTRTTLEGHARVGSGCSVALLVHVPCTKPRIPPIRRPPPLSSAGHCRAISAKSHLAPCSSQRCNSDARPGTRLLNPRATAAG